MRVLVLQVCFLLAVPDAWAGRIVSLLPSNTEIVEALGAGDQVVGVTLFEAPRPGRRAIGDFANPSVESIVALNPTIILAGSWSSSRIVPRLRRMGYPVVEVANPRTLEEIYASIRTLADAVGQTEAAPAVIATMRSGFHRLAGQNSGRLLRVYVEIDLPNWTIGRGEFLSDALRYAGLQNLFEDLRDKAGQVSSELIIQRDPEVILSLVAKKNEIVRRPGWSRITAVRKGQIIDDVSADVLTRPSPTLLRGVEAVAGRVRAWRP